MQVKICCPQIVNTHNPKQEFQRNSVYQQSGIDKGTLEIQHKINRRPGEKPNTVLY